MPETTRFSKGGRNSAIHIGTSGWHYKHWVGDFYPERYPPDKMFSWYAREFDTVEINNSFYRLPEEKTFKHWKELAPPGFIFAVKASRFITHIKRLKDAQDSVDQLMSRAKPLRSALGPVLFQLPPRWKVNVERLTEFLSVLPRDTNLQSNSATRAGTRLRFPNCCAAIISRCASMTGASGHGRKSLPLISPISGFMEAEADTAEAIRMRIYASGLTGFAVGRGS